MKLYSPQGVSPQVLCSPRVQNRVPHLVHFLRWKSSSLKRENLISCRLDFDMPPSRLQGEGATILGHARAAVSTWTRQAAVSPRRVEQLPQSVASPRN